MRYGDTMGKRTRRGCKAGRKNKFHAAIVETFTGRSANMAALGQSGTSLFDPWLCGRDGRSQWLGDETQVEIVTAGITEYSRIAPWASGHALRDRVRQTYAPGSAIRDRWELPA